MNKSDEFAERVDAAARQYAAEVCKRGYTDEQSATLAFIEGASFAVADVRRELRAPEGGQRK